MVDIKDTMCKEKEVHSKGAHFRYNEQTPKVGRKVHEGMCCNNPSKRWWGPEWKQCLFSHQEKKNQWKGFWHAFIL